MHFYSVKLLAWKSGSVIFFTNIMSVNSLGIVWQWYLFLDFLKVLIPLSTPLPLPPIWLCAAGVWCAQLWCVRRGAHRGIAADVSSLGSDHANLVQIGNRGSASQKRDNVGQRTYNRRVIWDRARMAPLLKPGHNVFGVNSSGRVLSLSR